MPDSPEFVVYEIPARIADLEFRIALPRDWNRVDLPAQEVDFSSPEKFFPLMLAAAPWAAVVLTVAARPGFDDGTLQDWSLFLLSAQDIRPTSFSATAIGALRGLAGVGRQQQEDTSLEVRFAFFEDGGRLVYLGLMSPEAISASFDAVWQRALESFALARPQGQNVPIGAAAGIAPDRIEEPASAPEPPPAEREAPQAAEPSKPEFTESDFGYYAKADHGASLDSEDEINARLRDQGVGFTPTVLELDRLAKFAKVGAGAIQGVIKVALGWHVIDDGRRTMVLDPDGKIQINLSVIPKDGRNVDQMLDDIQAQAGRDYPNPEFLRAHDGGIWGLAIRNIEVNGEPVQQVHMLTPWAQDSAMLRARVTTDPPSFRYGADYADLILKSAYYGEKDDDPASENQAEDERAEPSAPLPSSSSEPAWFLRAQKLEREDRLEEMEQVMRDSIPYIGCAISIADLYRTRWLRLQGTDPEKAADARRRAASWAGTYASWATSGGEGVALSYERDQFLKTLGPEPFD